MILIRVVVVSSARFSTPTSLAVTNFFPAVISRSAVVGVLWTWPKWGRKSRPNSRAGVIALRRLGRSETFSDRFWRLAGHSDGRPKSPLARTVLGLITHFERNRFAEILGPTSQQGRRFQIKILSTSSNVISSSPVVELGGSRRHADGNPNTGQPFQSMVELSRMSHGTTLPKESFWLMASQS